jgi:membrane protein
MSCGLQLDVLDLLGKRDWEREVCRSAWYGIRTGDDAGRSSSAAFWVGPRGAIWSSSAALVAIVSSLNRAYDIEESRPWWKVRLTAVGLTIALALLVLTSFTLVVAGPTIAEHLASSFWAGAVFEWSWKILQWPVAFFLVSMAVGLVYYFAPDAEQDWTWITPGAVIGTLLWMVISLAFRYYVTNFTDYNATYGAVGGVIVLLLWFYISGLAILVGAELNAEIERASPHGKASGERRAHGIASGEAGGTGHSARAATRREIALIADEHVHCSEIEVDHGNH